MSEKIGLVWASGVPLKDNLKLSPEKWIWISNEDELFDENLDCKKFVFLVELFHFENKNKEGENKKGWDNLHPANFYGLSLLNKLRYEKLCLKPVVFVSFLNQKYFNDNAIANLNFLEVKKGKLVSITSWKKEQCFGFDAIQRAFNDVKDYTKILIECFFEGEIKRNFQKGHPGIIGDLQRMRCIILGTVLSKECIIKELWEQRAKIELQLFAECLSNNKNFGLKTLLTEISQEVNKPEGVNWDFLQRSIKIIIEYLDTNIVQYISKLESKEGFFNTLYNMNETLLPSKSIMEDELSIKAIQASTEVVNFFVERSKTDRFDKYLGIQAHLNPVFVNGASPENFLRVLRKMRPSTQFFIWFHLEHEEKREGELYPGEQLFKEFEDKVSPQIRPRFFTTGSVGLIGSTLEFENSKVVGTHGIGEFNLNHREEVYSVSGILKDSYLRIVEKSKCNQEIKKKSKGFCYRKFRRGSEQSLQYSKIGLATFEFILGECLLRNHEQEYNDQLIWVEFLTPGLSGAYILSVHFDENAGDEYEGNILIKINKNVESLRREIKLDSFLYEEPLSSMVLLAKRGNIHPIVEGYQCVLFDFFSNGNTLFHLLYKGLKSKQEKNITLLKSVLKKWEIFIKRTTKKIDGKKKSASFHSYRCNPWDGYKEDDIIGIKPTDAHLLQIRRTLKDIQEQFPKTYLKKFGIVESEINDMINRVEDEDKHVFEKGIEKIKSPIGYIHADFHGDNILIREEEVGVDVKFIDLAAFPENPNQNLLIDLGKLSVFIELNLMPNKDLNANGMNFYNKWNDCHNKFFRHEELHKDDLPISIQNIYQLSKYIECFAVETFSKQFDVKDVKIADSNIRLQFHLARLAELLKQIGFRTHIREKIFFCIKASIDLVRYLKKEE